MSSDFHKTVSLAGDPTWAVTGYETVRRLMADPRLDITHEDPASAPRCFDSQVVGRPKPSTGHDLEDHQKMRRVLRRSFTARRLETVRPKVKALVTALLDDLAAAPQPADVHALVSTRLPALAWASLLGIPETERGDFEKMMGDATDVNNDARLAQGVTALFQYIPELIVRKLDDGGEDVLSDLAAAHKEDPEANSIEFVSQVAAVLNFAGHLPTVAALDDSVVLMLTHPEEREALVKDPSLVDSAAEEVLRYAISTTPEGHEGAMGLPRWAVDDLTVDGVDVCKGELLMLDQWDANRDESVFPDPHRFDIRRTHNPHVSFGFGRHFCVGAPLARMELQELLAQLFVRFPELQLAVPEKELRPAYGAITGGYAELPVRW